MVTRPVQEHLRLIFQPSKGAGMDDARAIALEFRAVTVALLGIFPAPRIAGFLRKRRQDSALVGFHFFPRLPSLTHDGGAGRITCHAGNYSSLRRLCEPGVRVDRRSGFVEFSTLRATLPQSNEPEIEKSHRPKGCSTGSSQRSRRLGIRKPPRRTESALDGPWHLPFPGGHYLAGLRPDASPRVH